MSVKIKCESKSVYTYAGRFNRSKPQSKHNRYLSILQLNPLFLI